MKNDKSTTPAHVAGQTKSRAQKKSTPRPDLESFRARLPHPTLPTNLPGVFAIPPLPAGFDPNTASRAAMIKHGLVLRRPNEKDPPALLKAWKHAFARPWSPAKHIVPEMEVHTGRTHRLERAGNRQEGGMGSPWAGSVLMGNWSVVSASWVVPQVAKPNAPLGPGHKWDSLSWVGIGGDGESDLFQAGVDQRVDKNGKPSYYAWYEWLSSTIRLTLGDTTPSNYALCSDPAGDLLMAFRGEDNHINFLISTDQGNSFGHKLTTGETSSYGPAMAFSLEVLLVAWTGHGNDKLNTAQVTFNGSKISYSDKKTQPFKSPKGPALAILGSQTFIAFIDQENRINVALSSDLGSTFGPPLVSAVITTEAPSITFLNEQLLVAWKDANQIVNVGTVELTGGAPTNIVNITPVPSAITKSAPTLVAQDGMLFLAWRETDDHLAVGVSFDSGQTFGGFFTSPIERSPSAPALLSSNDLLFIGWRGENDHLDFASLGVRNRAITGFGPVPAYNFETEIKNFPVTGGDEVVCTVDYSEDLSGGYVYLGNLTNQRSTSFAVVAPTAAQLTGTTIEWIMERPLLADNQLATLPKFGEVIFTNAVGCGGTGSADASSGTTMTIIDGSNNPETSEALAPAQVTITYISSD